MKFANMDMRIDSIDSMDSVPEYVSDTFANDDVISTLVSRLNITHPAVDVSDLTHGSRKGFSGASK